MKKYFKKKIREAKRWLRGMTHGERPLSKRVFNRAQRREWTRMRLIGFTNLWRIRRRQKNKHVYVDPKVLAYTEDLAGYRFTAPMLDLRADSESLEHSELQVDITEAAFLKLIARMAGAHQILEVGTFRGWSTAVLAEALIENELENGPVFKYHSYGQGDASMLPMVTTIELRATEGEEARRLWDTHLPPMVRSRINMIMGDANVVLKKMVAHNEGLRVADSNTTVGMLEKAKTYELIFIDADKGSYEGYINMAKQLVVPGGLIVIDNTLNAGLVATSAQDRTTLALKHVNAEIFNNMDSNFEPILIPAWDGVVILRRRF